MKVLLVIPTVDTCYERVPSMGLMNLYLIAKKSGTEVELIDLTNISYSKGLEKILQKRYDLIGISCNFTNAAPFCMRYARDIKQRYPDTLIISGGNHATLVPEDLLYNGYDYIVSGEGELTFRELLDVLDNGSDPKRIKGLTYLDGDNIKKTPERGIIEDMDSLPINDYSEFNLEPYFRNSGLRYISMETARGCIYNCSFCSTVRMWGHKFRHKSPERILEEFRIAKKMDLEFVFIEDDDTALGEDNLRRFCELLAREDRVVPWGMGIGSNSIRDKSTFDLLVKAGCIKVNVNIESANPRLLKLYRKPYTMEDNRKLCEELNNRKILIHNHGIIGYTDETVREMLNTYFFLIKTSPIWHISVLEPRPGSDYWKSWEGRGKTGQYRLFGKANVIMRKSRLVPYLIYRFFALFYFLNPVRIWRSVFSKEPGIRYSYRIQYHVAMKTIRQNIIGFFTRNGS